MTGSDHHGVFFRAVGAVTTLRVLGGALLLASQVLLAGWMGPGAFGRYSFAWAWVAVLATLAGLGFANSSVRFLSAYRATGDHAKLRGLVRFGNRLTPAVACGLAAIGIAVVTVFATESPYRDPLRLAFLAIPVLAFLNLDSAYSRGFHWMTLPSFADQIARPTLLIALGWLTVHVVGTTSANAFVLACGAAYLLAATGLHFAVHARMGNSIASGPIETESRVWMRVSFAMLLVSGSQMVRINTDLVMVGLFLEPADVGVYTAALRTSTLVSIVFMVTGIVAQPTIASLFAQERRRELQRFVTVAARWIFGVSLGISVFVVAFGTFALSLFGPDFVAGYDALVVLTAGHVVVAVFGPATALLAMTGHQDSAALVHGLSVPGTIALNAALIPLFGIVGAGVAAATTGVLMHVALLRLARRDLRISPSIFGARAARR